MFLTTCDPEERFTQLDAVGRLTCLFSICFLCIVGSIVLLLWLKFVSFRPSDYLLWIQV